MEVAKTKVYSKRMKAKLFDRENNFIKDHTVPYAMPILRVRLLDRRLQDPYLTVQLHSEYSKLELVETDPAGTLIYREVPE